MDNHILRTFDLCKKYKDKFAVENVNMEINEGQIYGFIGRNGAGKTTLIRMVCGLTQIGSGQVELFGETSPEGICKARARIGSIIETPALYPGMTAEQNLEIYRLLTGTPGKKRIGEVLDMVGLSGTGNKKVKNFSLGMKQRLALALSLTHNPEFIILDEPMNGLDPEGIVSVRETLKRLSSEHKVTILVSSHILGELSLLATHYGIIDKGRLIRQISKEQLALECRQYLKIHVDDAPKAAVMLQEKMGIESFEVMPGNILHLFTHLDKSGEINALLAQQGIRVSSLSVKGQDLEGYFMNVIGGVQHA